MEAEGIQINIIPAVPDMPGFDGLRDASQAEGFSMLARLQDEWTSGANVFSEPGERLLGAEYRGELVGIGGLNVDPYADGPRQGRVRRFYVRPDFRRRGVSSALIGALLEDAGTFFDALNVRAPEAAAAFYERLGFAQSAEDQHRTHSLRLQSASGEGEK